MTKKETKSSGELERRVADAYRQMGAWKVEHDVPMAGHQVDVYVEMAGPDRSLHRIAVEAKCWQSRVGIEVVRDWALVVDDLRRAGLVDEGVIVSSLGFTKPARQAVAEHVRRGLPVRLLELADLEAMDAKARATGSPQPAAPPDVPPPAPRATHPSPETVRGVGATHVPRVEPTEDLPQAIPSSEAATQAQLASIHKSKDLYSRYETGLDRMLKRLGLRHPRYSEALVYQQRLSENIHRSRKYGDTDKRKAERSEIIDHLNELALSALGVPFSELYVLTLKPCSKHLPDAPETILIPAGPFWIGSPLDDSEACDNERPRREVNLAEYQIGRYPVTNAQYACFVRDTGQSSPEHWENGEVPAGLEDHPVMSVNYGDTVAYCRWLSQTTGQRCRLPTEAEWEKAARGCLPETRRYPWGDEWRPGMCNTRELGRNKTTSIHEFEQVNRSPFGVVDIAGNVWEWTASWYERYPDSPHEGLHYGRLYRVVRGGSWQNSQREARISCRGRYKPDVRRPYLGFRIMLEISG